MEWRYKFFKKISAKDGHGMSTHGAHHNVVGAIYGSRKIAF
jgi:hypothetical protein